MSKGLYSYDSWQTEGMVIGQWLKEFTDTVICYRYILHDEDEWIFSLHLLPPDTLICSIMPKKENCSGCHFIFFLLALVLTNQCFSCNSSFG